MKKASTFIAALAFCVIPAGAGSLPPVERVEIRAEGLYVNGKPFFPVGIGWAGHWHYSLPEASAMGFNLVATHGLKTDPHSFRADIDDAYANGMYAAASVGNGVWKNLELRVTAQDPDRLLPDRGQRRHVTNQSPIHCSGSRKRIRTASRGPFRESSDRR